MTPMNSPATWTSTESSCFGRSTIVIVSRRNRLRKYFSRRQISLRVKICSFSEHCKTGIAAAQVAWGRDMVKSVLTRTVPVRQARAMQSNAPQGYYAASAGPASAAVSLRGDAKADVCIIGAGYTGLSAALHLATAGANVIVIEAESIGFGASGRNGGQIHPGHRKSQAELEHWLGVGHARDLWKLSEEARNLVFELASQDCELKRGLVIAVHNERAARELTQDTEYLSSHYGYTESRMLDRMQVQAAVGTDLYPAARMDGGGGHVHPLKYARKLAARAVAAGATIYVRSPALRIDRQTQ